jgi:hypothetical protein
VWCPAENEAEGFIYRSRFAPQERLKLSPPRVMGANHHEKQDTRSRFSGDVGLSWPVVLGCVKRGGDLIGFPDIQGRCFL